MAVRPGCESEASIVYIHVLGILETQKFPSILLALVLKRVPRTRVTFTVFHFLLPVAFFVHPHASRPTPLAWTVVSCLLPSNFPFDALIPASRMSC